MAWQGVLSCTAPLGVPALGRPEAGGGCRKEGPSDTHGAGARIWSPMVRMCNIRTPGSLVRGLGEHGTEALRDRRMRDGRCFGLGGRPKDGGPVWDTAGNCGAPSRCYMLTRCS